MLGRAARSKHSETWRRSLLASVIDLKKKVFSCTPLMPKVLLTLPTPAAKLCAIELNIPTCLHKDYLCLSVMHCHLTGTIAHFIVLIQAELAVTFMDTCLALVCTLAFTVLIQAELAVTLQTFARYLFALLPQF